MLEKMGRGRLMKMTVKAHVGLGSYEEVCGASYDSLCNCQTARLPIKRFFWMVDHLEALVRS